MSNVTVVGLQWGDEGKGKLVDWLSEKADIIVRFQGGHNAGHTLVIDGKVYKLSLLPSGIVRPGKISVIGNGVVIDPWKLLEEIELIEQNGIKINSQNLKIADNACLILPLHRDLDTAREDSISNMNIGTTRKGIGPAYEDKIGRRALRVCDLTDKEFVSDRLKGLLHHHNILRSSYGQKILDHSEIMKSLSDVSPKILSFSCPVWKLLDEKIRSQSNILFEGAQGSMLDIDHGTYPFVTSSNTHAAFAAIGSGVPSNSIDYVLGITKAYATRVGEGPFPTELKDSIGKYIGQKGNEFGTVTGRERRCGWLDVVSVNQQSIINGVQGIALTKLDVLDGMKEIKICTKYKLDNNYLDYFPSSTSLQSKIKPVYETLPGWEGSVHGLRKYNELPDGAKKFVQRLQEIVNVPISLISTSPEREDTIVVNNPFG